MPIGTPEGFLDITNATLRTSVVGISNTGPTGELSIGSNLHVDTTSSNVLHVVGNTLTHNLTLGTINLTPAYGLENVVNVGSSTSQTVTFSNITTGLTATTNVDVQGQVKATNATLGLVATSNIEVGGQVKATNPTLGLVATSNIEVGGQIKATNPTLGLVTTSNAEVGTANLYVDTTTGRVGIGSTQPRATLDINKTDAMILPSGTTAEEPATGITGMVRLNTTIDKLQFYNGNRWSYVGGGSVSDVSPTNLIAESGPHGRGDQSTPTPRKFPGFPMTSNTTPLGYVASASSHASATSEPWVLFNQKYTAHYDDTPTGGNNNIWLSAGSLYNSSVEVGLYTGLESTTVDGIPILGEWVQLQTPKAFKLTSTYGYPPNGNGDQHRSPRNGKIVGSNDGTTWTEIISFFDLVTAEPGGDVNSNQGPGVGISNWAEGSATNFGIVPSTVAYYKYYRLIIQKANGNDGGYTSLAGWDLYGISEDDSEFVAIGGDTSTDVTIRSQYNTPAVSGYKLYLDGVQGSTATDLSTGSITVTENNVTYDATEKAWVFDGSTESNIVSATLGFEGDQPLSVSTWFKSSNLETNVSTSTIFNVGTAGGEGFAKAEAGVDLTTLITANTWHNLAFTSNGHGLYNHTYLDGKLIGSLPSHDTARYYPDVSMRTYSQDGYNVSVSSQYHTSTQNRRPFLVFNQNYVAGINYTSWKTPDTYSTTGTPRTYVGYQRLGTSTSLGEWIKLEMPYEIFMTHVHVVAEESEAHQAPESFKVYGSNDNVNWTEILSETGAAPGDFNDSQSPSLYYADDTSRAYKFFGFVSLTVVGQQYLTLAGLRYFGHRVNDLVRFPDSTTVRKFPDTVMASNGPQRGYTVSASSTQSSTYEVYNIFHLDLNKEWRSDTQYGSGGAYTGSRNLGTGAVNGEWVKIEMPHKIVLSSIDLGGDTGYLNRAPEDFKVYGSNDDTNWTELISETGITPLATPGTNHTSSSSTAYKYFALVVTRTYTTFDYVAIETLVFNGTEVAEPVLARLGGSFEGKIANMRVYDRSIGERQVLEVWDAEKDRFGRGESSITVHKGRLGVGTKTPQATLDVRGNIFGPLLTHKSYKWTATSIQRQNNAGSYPITLLIQEVEIPEIYKNISPLNLRLSYTWNWFGEVDNNADGQTSHNTYDVMAGTSVKYNNDIVEHMNLGRISSLTTSNPEGAPIGVTILATAYHSTNDSSTPEMAVVPGFYELKNVTSDKVTIDLYMIFHVDYPDSKVYTNRTVDSTLTTGYERGCSTLTVFMEPY